MNNRDRQILQIAVPSIVSNITVPLLGLIDVAIVGHMGSPAYIGAVAVGSMIFNLIYWLFGFLRMSTSGLTAQAYGRRDLDGVTRILVRSGRIALLTALAIIVLQLPLKWLMFWLMGPTPDVTPYATTYFHIVVWGAPAMLGLYSLSGWFIGMQNTRIPMFVSIMQNVVNILASLTLVYGFGMKIEGVALGTVIAQYAGLLVAVGLLKKTLPTETSPDLPKGEEGLRASESGRHTPPLEGVGEVGSLWAINRDLFLRTVCLVGVNLFFTSASARQGAVVLSVNTVMLQLFLFFSYFMDGFAYAGEALGGRFCGARNKVAFSQTLRRLFGWALVMTILFTVLYIVCGTDIVRLLTDEEQVRMVAHDYIWWVWLVPVAGAAAFIWDGVFVGITASRGMLVATAVATLSFAVVYLLTKDVLGNNGLWLAQIVYLAMRGILQTIWYKRKVTILQSEMSVC